MSHVEQTENDMHRALGAILLSWFLLVSTACDRSTQNKARERQAEAERKIRKLGSQAKQRAREMDRDIKDAVQPDGDHASQKLDNAALLTKVKAKLASDLGVATLTNVNVDTSGSVVTLRGTVASDTQRQAAQRTASQVSGVTSVVNELKVAP
jgi:hyperosmotically inducible periplasmic protein